jgi:hypothetical protein
LVSHYFKLTITVFTDYAGKIRVYE